MADTDKPKMGRPLKFSSPKDLQTKVDKYFKNCDPHMATITEWVQARDSSGALKKDENGLNYIKKVTHKVITEPIPYTITGLALALDTTRDVLLDYESGKYDNEDLTDTENADFSNTIKRAKHRIAEYVERQLHTTTPTGAIFNLKANYKWRDNADEDTAPPLNPLHFFSPVPTSTPPAAEPPKE